MNNSKKYIITSFDVNNVSNIDISNFCITPCQHYCTITLNDNKKINKLYSGQMILNNFKHLLNNDDINHLK